MSLVKWIRKNSRKIMVFVIGFCMVAFVVGQFGLKLIFDRFDPNKKAFATYDNGKMNNYDVSSAQDELKVLRMLNADQMMLTQGTGGALLNYLIFPDSQVTGDIAAQLKQAAQRGQLPISLQSLEDYFDQQPENAAVLWLLLKAEAQRAGYLVAPEKAEQSFVGSIAYTIASQSPEMPREEVMQNAMAIASRTFAGVAANVNMTKQQLFGVFANLLTVVDYANQIMSNQAVTLNQVKSTLGRSKERLDAEFVKIDATTLIDEDAAVSEAEIAAQFDAFKALTPGNPTDDNPYGFGYKLPKRIQLEYMIVLSDDVKAQTAAPTAEETEHYYRNNIAQFQTTELSDPNDPESTVILTKSFTEAERTIRSTIERDKTNKLTAMIFNEIKDITEAGFENVTFDEATNEQLQMAAGDFEAAAAKIAETHKVTVTTGKTGWLSADNFQQEKILRTLARRQGQSRLPLSDLAFAATTEPKQKRRIGMPTIRVWENIGPVTGGYYDMENSKYHPMTALVRVVGIEEAAVPADAAVEYDTKGVALFVDPEEKTSYSVKDKVIEDLRLKKAMETARQRADKLAALVANSDWTEAIKAYNAEYAPAAEDAKDTDINELAVKLEMADDQTRAGQTEIAMARRYMLENPSTAGRIQQMLVANTLNNAFYALLEEGAKSTGTISQVLPFEASASCYVVKEVVRQPATEQDYLDGKAQTALQLGSKDTAELALVHFNSENILKRMNFERKNQDDNETETATETVTE